MDTEQFKNVGRNDPCPCGSAKKFKKCHGENQSWQGHTKPETPAPEEDAGPAFDPAKMDLNWLAEFSSAIQRLPKGQLQQLQSLMQKAMSGKDVARELEELQRKLPSSVQELMSKSPELGAQLESAANGSSVRLTSLTDEQKTKLEEIQKNNEKSGLSKLWNRFTKK